MKECPVCGKPLPEDSGICPVCGASGRKEYAYDPFADALKQEQKVRAAQDMMRQKYGHSAIPLPEPVKSKSILPEPDDTEPDAEPEFETAVPQKKERSALLYTGIFCAVLALAGGTAYYFGHWKNLPPKTDSFAFYAKDDDLWFYNGTKRKAICVSENSIPSNAYYKPAVQNPYRDSTVVPLDLNCYYQTFSHYDPESGRIWYPVSFQRDSGIQSDSISCTLMYRDLSDPNTEHKAAEIDMSTITRGMVGFMDYMPFDLNDVQIDAGVRPCVFLGNAVYYINMRHQFCRWEDGKETVVSEEVRRFWKGADNASVFYLEAESIEKDIQINSAFSCRSTICEEPVIPFRLGRIKNGETAEVLANNLTSWSFPSSGFGRWFYYTFQEDNTISFIRYDLEQNQAATLISQDNIPDWHAAVLQSYPDGSCYAVIQNVRQGEMFNYDSIFSDHDTMPQELPQSETSGVWYFDQVSGSAERLFPMNQPLAYFKISASTSDEPYLIDYNEGLSGMFHKSTHVRMDLNDESLNAVSFAPNSNSLLSLIVNSEENVQYTVTKDENGTHTVVSHKMMFRRYLLNGDNPPTPAGDKLLDYESLVGMFWHCDHASDQEMMITVGQENLLQCDAGELKKVNVTLCRDYPEYDRFYAVCDFNENKGTGKLQTLQNNQWQPVAEAVADYQQISEDLLYLYTKNEAGNAESAYLKFYKDGIAHAADNGITELLYADIIE